MEYRALEVRISEFGQGRACAIEAPLRGLDRGGEYSSRKGIGACMPRDDLVGRWPPVPYAS